MTASAEQAYLFRHALLRDAAYDLHLPAERARLHTRVIEILEGMHGGPPPDSDPDAVHAADAISAELAMHARASRTSTGRNSTIIRKKEAVYLRRAALHAMRQYQRETELKYRMMEADIETGPARQRALAAAAMVALEIPGNAGQARSLATEALDGDSRGVAFRVIAVLAQREGSLDTAERNYLAAIADFRGRARRRDEAATMNEYASLLAATSRLQQAEELYAQALVIARELGDDGLAGVVIGNQATLLAQTGRQEQGRHAAREAIERFRRAGLRAQEGIMLANLGADLNQSGETAAALLALEQAMAIHLETGNLRSQAITMLNMAVAHHSQGRLETAERLLRQSLALMASAGEYRRQGSVLRALALIEAETGRAQHAAQHAQEALAIFLRHGDARNEAITRCYCAVVEVQSGRRQLAQDYWQEGTAGLRAHGDAAELERLRGVMREACARAGVPPLEGARA